MPAGAAPRWRSYDQVSPYHGGWSEIRQGAIRVAGSSRAMLVDTVYDALKERIMDQAVPPGSRLTIEVLAVDLQVSPTPVREALARLAAERLVTFEPFKGYATMPLLTQQ